MCPSSNGEKKAARQARGTLKVVEEYEWQPTTYLTSTDQPAYIQVYEVIDGLTDKPMWRLFRYLHLSILPEMGSLYSRLNVILIMITFICVPLRSV